MSETGDLTLRVLREIRDEVSGTNRRVDHLREETTRRLDHLAEGQVRLATEVADLRGEVGELRTEVTRQGERLENAFTTGGQVVQGLRLRVERLEQHTGLEGR